MVVDTLELNTSPAESLIWDMYCADPTSLGALSLRILYGYVQRFMPVRMARVDKDRLLRDIAARIAELEK